MEAFADFAESVALVAESPLIGYEHSRADRVPAPESDLQVMPAPLLEPAQQAASPRVA